MLMICPFATKDPLQSLFGHTNDTHTRARARRQAQTPAVLCWPLITQII